MFFCNVKASNLYKDEKTKKKIEIYLNLLMKHGIWCDTIVKLQSFGTKKGIIIVDGKLIELPLNISNQFEDESNT